MPQNLPERISRTKLVEELLDRIVERGFLTLGEVRDAISRNQLKEPDCSGPRSFLQGDAALRVNRRMTETLDGVYEPGDFYVRWILRFSHLMFGTVIGRFLTLYFVVPFGGPFVALKGLDYFVEELGFRSHLAPTNHDFARLLAGNISLRFAPTLLLGVFLMLLFHVPSFRRGVWSGLKMLGRVLKFLLIDSVGRFFALPWVRWIVDSVPARLAMNFVVKPLVPTLLVAEFMQPGITPWQKTVSLAGIFFALALVVNSAPGGPWKKWPSTPSAKVGSASACGR